MSTGPGSTGNVLAAICSFFLPGLGQLVQGRPLMALFQLLVAVILFMFCLHWLIPLVNLASCLDAALYKRK